MPLPPTARGCRKKAAMEADCGGAGGGNTELVVGAGGAKVAWAAAVTAKEEERGAWRDLGGT